MNAKKFAVAVFLAVTVLGGSGCALLLLGGLAGGAGAVAYSAGTLRSHEAQSMEKVLSAADQALMKMSLPTTRVAKEANRADLQAKTLDGRPVTIIVKRVSDQVTDLSIHVGAFGDETLSRQILATIQAGY